MSMDRVDVLSHLSKIRHARKEVERVRREVNCAADTLIPRLLHEAAREMMSLREVADALGVSVKRVRVLMREAGMNPTVGAQLRASHAVKALRENAALLGVDPREIDIMSPLQYLPGGQGLKTEIAVAEMGQIEIEDEVESDLPEAHAYAVEVLVNAGSSHPYWRIWSEESTYYDDFSAADSEREWLIDDGYRPEHVRVVEISVARIAGGDA